LDLTQTNRFFLQIANRGFCLLLVVALLSFVKLDAQNDWTQFSADEVLSFQVDVPDVMEKSKKTIKTAVGELTTYTYAYQGAEADPNYLYLINCVQYPEGTFPTDSIELIDAFLENAAQTSAERVSGSVVYTSEMDNDFGKLFRIKYNDGEAVIKGKSYIQKDVFILLQVFTVQSKSLNDEMDYFLDSFRIDLE